MVSVSVPPVLSIAPPPAGADPLIGTTVGGRYTILQQIGAGGMGRVYLANQPGEPREVVVKVVAPHWMHDEAAKGRFDREAQALATLRHPNIVQMYDFGWEGQRAYLVMEYLRGVPLSEHLKHKSVLALPEFVPIAAQILKGTGYAHSREIIVRDIKPANVMLCEHQGRANFVKMLDFGLAKLVHDDSPITRDQMLGTLGYIAPETASGQAPDLRVDVYALGVLFYTMLAGRLPFNAESGGSAAMLYRTVNTEPDALADALPSGHDVPSGLIELVHQCLRKDPDERPADANVMVEQMIDVVPAAMFRLQRAAAGDSQAAIPGLSGLFTAPAATASGTTPGGTSGSASAPATSATPQQPVPHAEPLRRGGNLGLLVGLLVGAAGFSAALATQCGDGRSDPATDVASSPTKPAAPDTVAPEAAPPRVASAAIGVASEPPVPPKPAGTVGLLVVSSTPAAANVLVDGEVVGVTPYHGKAVVGMHTLALEAPGYHRWSSQLDVTTDPAEPVAVTLVPQARAKQRRGGGRPRGDASPDSASTPVAETPVPLAPASSPTPAARPLLKSGNSDSGLLPSGKPRKSDILLKGD